jgi:uncharacterized protein
MDRNLENQLRKIVRPYLEDGRPGDYEHTLRTIKYGRKLLEHEEGEEDIVIPALYLHDIGWSQVNFDDFVNAPINQKRGTVSVDLHMKHGAALAKTILEKQGYQPEKILTIASIIAIHDKPEKIFAMENPSATLVLEADFLDKYGPEGYLRFQRIFGTKLPHMNEVKAKLRAGLTLLFKTKTGKSMSINLARESGLFDGD